MGGYWALRALVFGMCATVIVILITAACTPDPALRILSPTLIPSLTLALRLTSTLSPPFATPIPVIDTPDYSAPATSVVYLVREEDTLTTISADFGIAPDILQTLNPDLVSTWGALLPTNARVLIPQPTLRSAMPALILQMPTCHPSEPETLLCLGSVYNPLGVAVEDVRVRLLLIQSDGSALARVVQLDQRVIPPREHAAYAVAFRLPPQARYHQVIVSLLDASPAADAAPPVKVDVVDTGLNGRRYWIDARITPTESSSNGARVFVVISLRDGRVVGYRVFEVGALTAGQAHTLTLDVPLLWLDGALSYSITAEAVP